eukprot:NODE_59_length_28102_cov_0.971110.p17 type:complete len:197 gc:universal NODE_59_length_28102_cov_0.971110:13638-14228(+)
MTRLQPRDSTASPLKCRSLLLLEKITLSVQKLHTLIIPKKSPTLPHSLYKEQPVLLFYVDSSVVQVTLPNPGQTLVKGSVYNIGWTLHSITPVLSFKLELFKATDIVNGEQVVTEIKLVKNIAKDLNPNKITFMWKVDDLETSSGYYIRITGDLGNGKTICGVSGEFYIANADFLPIKFKIKRENKLVQKLIQEFK